MKKKALSLLLTLSMLLSLVPAFGIGAMAAEAPTEVSTEAELAQGGYLKLTQDITLATNTSLPDNTTIALNGHSIDKNNKTFTVGKNFVLEIANETDLDNANKITDFDLGKTYTWKLTDSFTLSKQITNGVSDKINANIIFDGNGKTITATKSGISGEKNYIDYAFYFNRDLKMYDKIEIKDLTLVVGDGFRSGIQFSHINGVDRGATLTNVTIKMDRNNPPMKNGNEVKYGAAIVNNISNITVKNYFKIETDQYSWGAINVDGQTTGASVTFDSSANVTFVDNRTLAKKTEEPLVGTEGSNATVTDTSNVAGLLSIAKDVNGTNKPNKGGYDLPTAAIGDNKYATLKVALDSADSGDTVVLLDDAILGTDVGVKENVTLDLNGFAVDNGNGAHSMEVGANFTILISCEDDLNTAEGIAQQAQKRSFIWKLKDSFTVKNTVSISPTSPITIDGNNKTVTAKNTDVNHDSQTHIFSFVNSTGSAKDVTIKNLTLKLDNGFRSGLNFHNSSASINAELNGVTIIAERDTAPKKESSATTGVLIQNNGCTVTVKNGFDLTTDAYCWSAIDADYSANVTFDNDGDDTAQVTISDNRLIAKKAEEPLVGLSKSATVTNADIADLYVIAKNANGTNMPKNDGYILPVAQIVDGNKFVTVQKAVTDAIDGQTVKMLDDSTENITIDKNITLDLNNKVLKGTGTSLTPASVITNNGTLTIVDNATSKTTRYFTDSNNDGCYETCFDTVPAGSYLTVTGGIITGGNSVWGGGIDNKGTLYLESGNIVGCQVRVKASGGSIGGSGQGDGNSTFRGGAIYNSGSFFMNGGSILGCRSSEEGGGIFNAGTVTLNTGLIAYCSAQNGGALYNYNRSETSELGANFVIKNCKADGTEDEGIGYGGAIYNGKTLTFAGKIESSAANKFGGGIFNKGTLDMNAGAVIEGCSAEKGAGVHNDGNTGVAFTMTGGEIKNNTAKRTDGGKSTGGGVQVSANSTFTMTGGSITGNKTDATTQYGAGVYNKGTMTVGGTAKITENKNSDNTTISNLFLASGKTVSLSTTTAPVAKNESAPTNPYMLIGISTEASPSVGSPVAVTGTNAADYSSYFTSDDSNYIIKNTGSGSALVVKLGVPVAQIGEEKYLTVQEAIGAATAGQTVKMLADSEENVTIASEQNITLDLNDHVLKSKVANTWVVLNWGTLTVKDSASSKTAKYFDKDNAKGLWTLKSSGTSDNTVIGGCITGGVLIAGDSCGGGIFNANTLTIDSGNIVGNEAAFGGGIANFGTLVLNDGSVVGNYAMNGGAVYNAASNTFTMKKGTIAYNAAQNYGGAVFNFSKAVFNMEGGTIDSCKALNTTYGCGGAVMNVGQFTLSDGIISNCVANYTGGAVFSDGLPINNGIEPGNADATTFKMIGGEINSCEAPNHSTYKESVYLRHSVMEMTGGKLQGMIFENNNATCNADGQTPCGHTHVNCAVTISGGYFNYSSLTAGSTQWAGKDWLADGCKVYSNPNLSTKTAYPYVVADKQSSNSSVSTYAVSSADATHGSVTANTKNASVGSTVKLTVKADKGWTLETLTVKDAKGNEVTLTAVKVGETYTFKMPSSAVTVTATFMEDNTMLNFFVDVKADDYFYDAVLWAAENGITSGVDATHFAPNNITTRGQMVTFLWRAAGCPEPTATTCAFTDLKVDEFYYKAVLWAVENGLTKGVSATKFAPDVTVNRAQSVTFLARYEGVKDDATGYSHGFADVVAADYFNNAVAWAVTNKVTDGTSETTFEPYSDCLRAQIVTFIYRNFSK